MKIIERMESEVRAYCRSFPTVFDRARGSYLYGAGGKAYLDFFAGAGALNYGHNHPVLRDALLTYLMRDGVAHALDMATEAKIAFLHSFEARVLTPRDLRYKVMFPGPTGTNAVEAALKLARKVTGRTQVVSFTNAFHGMTLGSLAATGNAGKRSGAGVPLQHVTRMPFDGYFGAEVDTLDHLRALIADGSSGVDAPAAFLLETVQGEGGVNVASAAWLRGLAQLARESGALLIVDDIQVGCGRTGSFFSFETLGVTPDIVCLSKSLSAFGLPLALVLLKPDLDAWTPGEHNGTFRGNNLAFVTAASALEHFWSDTRFSEQIQQRSAIARSALRTIAEQQGADLRGRGLILGLAFSNPTVPQRASQYAFERGLLIETAGASGQVLKLLPPLTLSNDELAQGLDIIQQAIARAQHEQSRSQAPARRLSQEVA